MQPLGGSGIISAPPCAKVMRRGIRLVGGGRDAERKVEGRSGIVAGIDIAEAAARDIRLRAGLHG